MNDEHNTISLEPPKLPAKDLTGKKFNRLLVLGYVEKRGGYHYWRCQCDCGKEKVIRQYYLEHNVTRSCGCIQSEKIRETMKFVDGTSVSLLEKNKERLGVKNTSGHNGIYFNKKNQKWIAQITFKKKTHYLGSFRTLEEATESRKKDEFSVNQLF